jgi:hypothetical protein
MALDFDNPELLRALDDFAATVEGLARDTRQMRAVFAAKADSLAALPHILSMGAAFPKLQHHSAELENIMQLLRAEFVREPGSMQ